MKIPVIGDLVGSLNPRRVGSVLTVSLLSTAFVVAAVQSDGSTATNVQLDDGAVWVTSQDRNLVARLNLKIDELDIAVRGADTGLEVLQEGRTVLFTGREGGVQSLDVLANQASGSNEIPIVDYRVGGGVGAVLDSETGKLWTGIASSPVAPEYPDEPDAIVSPSSRLLVTSALPQTVVDKVNDGNDLPPRGRVLVLDSSGWREVLLDASLNAYREGADEPPPDSVPASTDPDGEIELEQDDGAAAGDEGPPTTSPPPEPLFEMPNTSTGVAMDDVAEVSAAGDVPVILTTDLRVVFDNERDAQVPGTVARLQQVHAKADAVYVASDTGLHKVTTGGDPQVSTLIEAEGEPSAPALVGSCVYSAWTGTEPTYARWCPDASRGPEPVPGAEADAELVWRVNQRNVALNSLGKGDVWAEHDGSLSYVGNWSDVEPRRDAEEVEQTQGESRVITERRCIEGGDEVPVAGDDQIGARPRQSILNVLTNDDDYNCEPIAISSVAPMSGEWGTLTVIDDGQHLLYSPSDAMLAGADDEIQSFQFAYTVSDAGGNTSKQATVTVAVKGIELGNSPPALRPKGADVTREMKAVVEEGQAVGYDVLSDWWDPDGDDLQMVSASPESEGEVSATPDGLVRYSANGVSPGILPVAVTMSDGIESATETLEVTVRPIGSQLPPVTTNDFVTTVVGATATVMPLANDSDPNEDTLSMRPLWTEENNAGYDTRQVGDAVEITANEAGSYLLRYEATDGEESTPGSILVTVLEPTEDNQAPVAVPDQVKLRPDRVVNVDVLANDVDLDGDLLAVVDADVGTSDPSRGEVRASIVDRRMVQIEVVPGPNGEEPTGLFSVSYQLADGFESVRATTDRTSEESIQEALQTRGAITVLVQPSSDDQPPILTADEAVVRVGDVVEVPVLRNDIDPDADQIHLVGVDPERSAAMEQAGEAVAWVEGRNVMVFGQEPGRYSLFYSAEAGGREASAELTIRVTEPADAETNPNQPPEPDDLEVRAIRGGSVRVRVPLTGVDPDGDSVTLLEDLGAPSGGGAGNRVEVDPENPGTIYFTAGSRADTLSEFTYTVRDAHGLKGTATVRVTILDDDGWSPQAHDDVWRGRPGRTLSLPVIANDSSPQDRRLELAAEPFFDLDGQTSVSPVNADAVRVLDQTDPGSRGRIDVDVPEDGTTLSEHYRISDGFNPSSAYIRVTPDPDTPNLPPVAQLDTVAVDEIVGFEVGESVPVDVLANDYDPDDAESPLEYSVPANQPGVFVNGKLEVPLTARSQIVLYRVTDSEGAATVGVVRVPGRENHPPELSDVGKDPTARTIEAAEAEPLTIALDDITQDPDGDPEVVLTDTVVEVLDGVGEVERLDDGSGFTYTPPENLTETAVVSIQFEATDRPDESEDGRQAATCNCLATLVVPLTVEASSPPRVVSAGAVQVPQLDEPVTYDIAPLVVDDQDDPLTYELDSGTFGGLDVDIAGSVLTLTSTRAGDDRLSIGTQIPIRYTTSDDTFDPVENTVVVTIVATNKGQPAPGALGPFEAKRDERLTLPNLLDAAVNPFAGDGHPLTLVDSRITAGGEFNCSEAGACTFFSSSTDTRQFTVTYTIADAVDQRATGSFEITMKGLPLAPGVPRVESVGDKVVNLSWTAADLQGGSLVTYVVTAEETGATKEFTSTGGAFDGLTNDTEYHFTVAATNELGLGESSAASSVAVPDRVPDPPRGLTFTDYGDRTLTMEWSPPATAGDYSAIKQYEVTIGGQVLKVDGSTTSITVGADGQGAPLQNGTDYSFSVRAQNNAKTDNGWGASTGPSAATERPSRYPDPPTNVVGVNSGDGGSPRITVTWNAPANDGGRAIVEYRVCRSPGGSCKTIAGSTRQATFDLGRGQDSTFNVVATNTDKNRADSDPSANSATVTAVGNPDPPTLDGVQSGDHSLTVQFTPRNGSGCGSATTEFSRNSGSSWQTSPTFTGLTNGTEYTVVGRTVLGSSCGTPGQSYVSGTSNSVSGTPYGPLVQPWIEASRSGNSITWTWDHRRGDDGRPNWSAALSGDCGSRNVTNNRTGSVTKSFSAGAGNKSCTITVSASGVSSKSDEDDATIPATQWNVTISTGGDRVCPEPDFQSPSNYNGGACNGDGYGWINNGTNLTVVCQRSVSAGWVYSPWVRIKSGTPYGGLYVPKTLVSGSMSGIPSC